MEWQDDGIIVGIRQHGENAAIVQVLTAEHGRCAGYIRGANARQTKPLLQIGNHVSVNWQGRLAEQLGFFSFEMLTPYAARFLSSPEQMNVLQSMAQLITSIMPERQSHPAFYRHTRDFLSQLGRAADWPEHYVRWEVALLRELGFGLQLTQCALNKKTDDLTHVSPKSGQAVSREAAAPYRDRLLPLPAFLGGADDLADQDIRAGLVLTGFFLHQNFFAPDQKTLPESRRRLQNIFSGGNLTPNLAANSAADTRFYAHG
jgi:DNA repair protein RecO (recombination protein O)